MSETIAELRAEIEKLREQNYILTNMVLIVARNDCKDGCGLECGSSSCFVRLTELGKN